MYLNIFKDAYKWLENLMHSFADFVRDHYTNPLLWLAFVGIGVAAFFITYEALQKEK